MSPARTVRKRLGALHAAALGLALALAWAPALQAGELQDCPLEAGMAAALLPVPALATESLSRLPEVRAAQAEASTAQARRRRLELGPYEWSARAGTARRRDQAGGSYPEHELGLETALRWPGKAAADRELGAQEAGIGELALFHAWQQAARRLLDDWFELLRESRAAELLEDQAGLAQRQLALTERRVQAGEVAARDRLLAEAELARADAAAAQTRLRAQSRLRALQARYAGLPLPAADVWTGLPQSLQGAAGPDTARWTEACAAQILAGHPELELMQARARQSMLKTQRSELERTGDPTLGLRVARERGGAENVLGVYASMPLGGEARRAATLEAQGEAQAAQDRLAETRQRVGLEAAQAAAAYPAALAVWRKLDTARTQAERGAQLQARAYELGEGSLPELLIARRGAIDATLAAEAAALDALQGLARLLVDRRQLWSMPGR